MCEQCIYSVGFLRKQISFCCFVKEMSGEKKKGSKLRVLHSTRLRIQFQVFAAYCFSCIYMSSCCLFKIKLEEKKKTTHTEIPECHLQTPCVYKTAPWFHRKRSVLPFTWRFVLPQLLCLLTHLPAQHPKEAVGTCRWLRRASADLVARCAAAGSGDVQCSCCESKDKSGQSSPTVLQEDQGSGPCVSGFLSHSLSS